MAPPESEADTEGVAVGLASFVQAVGILLVAAGAAMWSLPVGVALLGVGVLAFGLAMERG